MFLLLSTKFDLDFTISLITCKIFSTLNYDQPKWDLIILMLLFDYKLQYFLITNASINKCELKCYWLTFFKHFEMLFKKIRLEKTNCLIDNSWQVERSWHFHLNYYLFLTILINMSVIIFSSCWVINKINLLINKVNL